MKYLTLGIHYPKPEHTDDILAVVKKVADVALALPGIIETGAWLDNEQERIVMMSLWESEEHATKARETLRPLIMQSPWGEWERKPSENFLNLVRRV